MLTEILNLNIFEFFLVFARLGAMMMLMPGFSGNLIPMRMRLVLALAITFVITPLVAPVLPAMPADSWRFALLVLAEVTVGVFLGAFAQMLMAAVNLAGTFISFQAGLTNAFTFDPVAEAQGSVLTGFLSNLAVLLIFATDLHHLMLRAVADSYTLFVPGTALPTSDFSEVLARTLSASFRVGMQLAAPLMVFGLVFYAGLGLLARLVPQMQVFFVALPIQTMMGLFVFGVALPIIGMWFLRHFEDGFIRFLTPG